MRKRPPRQGDSDNLFGLRCECGRQLQYTTSGYLACPLGHGKLVNDTDKPQVDASGLFGENDADFA